MVSAGGPLTPVVPANDDDLPLVKVAILACTTDRVWGTSKQLTVFARCGVAASARSRIFFRQNPHRQIQIEHLENGYGYEGTLGIADSLNRIIWGLRGRGTPLQG